jgi:iron complex outermembrane receptor protein
VGNFSLAAHLFARERGDEILSTGRNADLYGGFFVDTEATAVGSTVQVTHNHHGGVVENHFTFGLEWLDGATDALGYFTPPEDPGRVNRSDPDSSNTTGRRTIGVFVQDQWRPLRRWSFNLGLRLDDDRVDFTDALDPANTDSRTFSELSVRAGANWDPTERYGLYASYGEGFLPPTAEELFAFPLFFSNPDLQPEDSRNYEVGFRGRWTPGLSLDLALFRIDTDDEIVFVPDPDQPFTGSNENVGETRREGVEAALRGGISPRLGFFVNATLTNAEFAAGPNKGNEVPLVPRERLAAGVSWELPASLALVAQGLYVGRQVLDSDNGNTQPKLPAYTVVDARLLWSIGLGAPKGEKTEDPGLRLFVEARNLLNEKYATRGIYVAEIFLTPAPGRRYLAGAEWRF